jgi:F-type H+-transporting ATPase subunit epsilon
MASHTDDVGEINKAPFSHGHKMLQCVVVTPEKTLLDEPVEFVALPLFDGELGVLPGRAPLVGRLGFGELRTKTTGVVRRYFVDGGFVQIRGNIVTVLTSRAVAAAEIDTQSAAHQLEVADKQRAVTDQEFTDQQKAVARARGMIWVASHKG